MGPSIPVIINGWERNWITRSLSEKQTYAGAIPNQASQLSAQLLALKFDESFEKREQDYRFTKIAACDLIHQNLPQERCNALHILCEKMPIYICETLAIEPSNQAYPVSLSYVDTCLAGSYESGGKKGIKDFFESTQGWENSHFFDDRQKHRYPRSSPLNLDDPNKWGALYFAKIKSLKNIVS